MDLRGRQIREAGERLYRMHELILQQDLDTLRTLAVFVQELPEQTVCI